MANNDKTNDELKDDDVVATATFNSNGRNVTVTSEFLASVLLGNDPDLDSYTDEFLTFSNVGEYSKQVTIESPITDAFPLIVRGDREGEGYNRPIERQNVILIPGDYFMVRDTPIVEVNTGEELAAACDYFEAPLLSENPEAITGDDVETFPIEVSEESLDDGSVTESITGYIFRYKGTGDFVTMRDVTYNLVFVAAIAYAAEKLGLQLEDEAANAPLLLKNGKSFTEAIRKSRKKNDIWPVGGAFIAEVGDIKMTAKDEKTLDTAIGSSKTMVYLNAAATATDYKYEPDKVCRVRASMTDLLEKRKIKDTKKNRAKIRQEVNALALTSWTVRNANTGEFVTIPLAGGKCSARGDVINFTFSPEFMGVILSREAGRMATNPALLGTDEVRNPHAFTIGWKLTTHSYQNIGKANETTLSVSKLLEYVEDIPTYDEVKKTDRAYTRRIIEPLERDLNHLVEIGFLEYWDYCHKKGEPLTDREQDQRLDQDGNECALPYETAIKLNIQWKPTEEYAKHREATAKVREQHRIDAEAAKQRNAERQARIEKKKETYIAKAAAKKEVGE